MNSIDEPRTRWTFASISPGMTYLPAALISVRAGGDGHAIARPDRFDGPPVDHDHGVADRGRAGAIDQRRTGDDGRGLRAGGTQECGDEEKNEPADTPHGLLRVAASEAALVDIIVSAASCLLEFAFLAERNQKMYRNSSWKLRGGCAVPPRP